MSVGTPDRTEAYRDIQRRLTHRGSVDAAGFIDLAWESLAPTGVSWIGFYRLDPGSETMSLEQCRDRPACSPIGLHGVCGQALRRGRTRIVRDVLELGDDYVACDPRDRAEIVIPLRPDRVLDLDSFNVDAFSDVDDRWLRDILALAGFQPIEAGPPLESVSGGD